MLSFCYLLNFFSLGLFLDFIRSCRLLSRCQVCRLVIFCSTEKNFFGCASGTTSTYVFTMIVYISYHIYIPTIICCKYHSSSTNYLPHLFVRVYWPRIGYRAGLGSPVMGDVPCNGRTRARHVPRRGKALPRAHRWGCTQPRGSHAIVPSGAAGSFSPRPGK